MTETLSVDAASVGEAVLPRSVGQNPPVTPKD